MGGDKRIFWGPWHDSNLRNLNVCTFLTLIVVPVMIILVYRLKIRLANSSTITRIFKNTKYNIPKHAPVIIAVYIDG